eukprot:CAMPEP_0202894508 /NCGR_PEP_ID=MMETSP1392-20130828/3906_1 /ASSEMBLY_ACC=CAM_ASM_000868 /TAXON_ID=225041 /ORGANISM="Chlamydomonas chlamydogama, Strain SAG 11-48b" /LENGTH=534 /DNA_ID=CAMNT_0049579235 /DNA_START=140 /DNA_END=1743 /DNA_ORIENTATION=-
MGTIVNIVDYIETLPTAKRDKLYESPWTCQAVLRSLPPLAKQYILRLLWVERPVLKEDMDAWVRDVKSFGSQHRAALDSLEQLGIIQQYLMEANRVGYCLHQAYRAQLRWSLSGPGHLAQEAPPGVQDSAPAMDDLDKFAHEQWEALQLYILTSSTDPPAMPADVPAEPLDTHRLLVSAGLLSGERRSRRITDTGFQFLLKDNYRQLWAFLTEYIRDAEARSGAELSSVMSFLMQLGFRRVGQPCAFDALSSMERRIAAHMMQLGLLQPFRALQAGSSLPGSGGRGALYFCPTRLASSLCGGFNPQAVVSNADVAGGHIIVETNYRVYAYTSSPVQVAILELFMRNDCVLPNLFVGTLTRDTVLKAITAGIGAEEIIDYLVSHCHPQVAGRSPVVPEVVMDQIRLWEAETLRLRASLAVLYDNFETPDLFTRSCEYARNLGVLLWANTTARRFAARDDAHDQIRAYIKSLKEAAGGATGASKAPVMQVLHAGEARQHMVAMGPETCDSQPGSAAEVRVPPAGTVQHKTVPDVAG